MKRALVVLVVLVSFAGGWVASDLISARRLTVVDAQDNPRIELKTDAVGAGELIVYDETGHEVFAVRGGRIISPDLDERLKLSAPSQSSGGGLSSPKTSTGNGPTVASVPVAQSDAMGRRPLVLVEVVEVNRLPATAGQLLRFRTTIRVTNISDQVIDAMTLTIKSDGVSQMPWNVGPLERKASDVQTFVLSPSGDKPGKVTATLESVRRGGVTVSR